MTDDLSWQMSIICRNTEHLNPYDLYRHYNAAGELLYVGISTSSAYRQTEHKKSSPWFHEVAEIKVERVIGWKEVLKAEREAIKKEDPKYNKVHKVKK